MGRCRGWRSTADRCKPTRAMPSGSTRSARTIGCRLSSSIPIGICLWRILALRIGSRFSKGQEDMKARLSAAIIALAMIFPPVGTLAQEPDPGDVDSAQITDRRVEFTEGDN